MQYIMICHSRRNASHGASAAALWALIVMYVCGTRESEATIGPLSGEWSPPALKVCMITMTTLNHEYVAGEDGQFSFEVAMATQAAYAARHGYPFFLSAVVPPGDEPHDKRLDWGRLYNIQRLQRQASGLCEWFFALEGDVIITNHSFDLSTVFNLAGNASFIINRDLAGNLNTGLYFVRSTPLAQDMMSFIASTRFSHKHDIRVKGWGFNGGTMVAFHNATIVANTALVPNKLINAYVGQWSPGDFIMHFAGHYPKAPAFEAFLEKYPPSTWPGYLPKAETSGETLPSP